MTLSLFDVYQGEVDDVFDTEVNPSPGEYHLVSLHGKLDLNKVLNWSVGQDLALLVQVDNLLDEEIWMPTSGGGIGNLASPVNIARTAYIGLSATL